MTKKPSKPLPKRKDPQSKAYAYSGKVYCSDHLPVNPWDDGVTPITKITQWKAYPQCKTCGKFFTSVNLER